MKAPNILWICTDQQRFDTIAAHGNPFINTPSIDRLAAEGVSFMRTYCQSPICTPSRSSFLTGYYASRVEGSWNGNERWAEREPLVTKLLADAGYDCGLAGKLHLAGAAGRVEPRPREDGYRVYEWSHSHRNNWPEGHAYADWLKSRGVDPDLMDLDPAAMPPWAHQTSWCAERAIDFMNTEREGPWLFSLNCFDPHAPFDPPQEYADRYRAEDMPDPKFQESDLAIQRSLRGADFQTKATDTRTPEIRDCIAKYYGMIELIDYNVGRMLDALEASGQAENTMVIFTSDHGEMLGDHGLMLKGCRFYEGLVRVPLIIRWPEAGAGARGARRDELVELLDLVPTLLEAAGLPLPEDLPGRSLLPALRAEGGPLAPKPYVRSEFFRALAAHGVPPPVKGGFGAQGNEAVHGSYGSMIFDGRYKLVNYHGLEAGELYDLRNDPDEHVNLWKDPGHVEKRFDLLKRNADAQVFSMRLGTEQTHRF